MDRQNQGQFETIDSSSPMERHFGPEGWCRCAFSAGTRHFFGHCASIIFLILVGITGFFWLAPHLGSSLKPAVQAKLNQYLDQTGIHVEFEDIQFVSGKGIRVGKVSAALTDADHFSIQMAAGQSEQNAKPSAGGAPSKAVRFIPVVTQKSGSRFQLPNSSTSRVKPECRIKIEEVWFRGNWSPVDFLDVDFQPNQVDLVGLKLTLFRDRSGRVLIPKISLPKRTEEDEDDIPPERIRIINSTITIESADQDQAPIVLKNFSIDFEQLPSAIEKNESTGRFVPARNVANQSQPSLRSQRPAKTSLPGPELINSRWKVSASVRPEGFDPIDLSGIVSKDGYDFRLRSKAIHIHQKFWDLVQPFFNLTVLKDTKVSGWVHLEKCQIQGRFPESLFTETSQQSGSSGNGSTSGFLTGNRAIE